MRKIGFLMLWITFPGWAIAPGNWNCAVQDAEQHQWQANANYQRAAVSQALEACRKQSSVPHTCQILAGCNAPVTEQSKDSSQWQCEALDSQAKSWKSGFLPNRDAAILTAQAQCNKFSSTPETCYVNDVTCRKQLATF